MLAPAGGAGRHRGRVALRRPGQAAGAWDEMDLMAGGCLGHLVAAALAVARRARGARAREGRTSRRPPAAASSSASRPRPARCSAFVAKVGPTDATVLLTGESGSGKEMVARAMHRASRRARQRRSWRSTAPRCPRPCIESELFGHERGAFTGATERKMGRFEAADKGTLFLDEVGELPLSCQTKFLRVLEEQVLRAGRRHPVDPVDVRVVAATNRDLGEMVRRGRLPRGPLLPAVGHPHGGAAAARAPDRHPDAGRALPGPAPAPGRAPRDRLLARGARGAGAAQLARQRARAAQRGRARHRAGRGRAFRGLDLPPPLGQRPARAAPSPAPTLPWSPRRCPRARWPRRSRRRPRPRRRPPLPGPARSLRELERDGHRRRPRATGGNKAQAAAMLEIDRSTLYKKIKDYGIDA